MVTRTLRPLWLLGVVFAALAIGANAQAATYLQLGTSNHSDVSTTLTGNSAGAAEFNVVNSNSTQPALRAQGSGDTVGAFSVLGILSATAPTVNSAAVRGQNNSTNAYGIGVWGSQSGSGIGVYGYAASGRGVFGYSADGTGISGVSKELNGTGVHGAANNGQYASGVSGESSTGAGVYGFSSGGTGQGVSGQSTVTNGIGVIGQANNGTLAYGVYGKSTSGRGVDGYSANGYGGYFGGATGVKGVSSASNGTGVTGEANSGANASGVSGLSASGDGVVGRSTATNGIGVWGIGGGGTYANGVYGLSTGGNGVYGLSSSGDGIYGYSGSGDAGYFHGHVTITGGCTGCTTTSSFRIDDPLDPAHKYLQHAAVVSSDQLDLYSGNVITGGKGFATVRLPRWFQALNRSFRYQLTVIGKTHWDAKAAVWEEIADNRFTIRTDQPSVTVSWQVTAVRHDPYANAHRSGVEVRKPRAEQGKYLHPELYGKPKREAIGYTKPPRRPRVPSQKR